MRTAQVLKAPLRQRRPPGRDVHLKPFATESRRLPSAPGAELMPQPVPKVTAQGGVGPSADAHRALPRSDGLAHELRVGRLMADHALAELVVHGYLRVHVAPGVQQAETTRQGIADVDDLSGVVP